MVKFEKYFREDKKQGFRSASLHADADPDPDQAFHFNADPDTGSSFHFNANPDTDPNPASHQGEAYRPSRPPFRASTPPFWASTALHGFILSLEELLNFDFNAEIRIRIKLFILMQMWIRIQIQFPKNKAYIFGSGSKTLTKNNLVCLANV